MAYTKNTWNTGDVIVADLMNHMEEGIEGNSVAAAENSALIENVRTAVSAKEDKANKVTEITSESTDEQYPSAKAVYDTIGAIEVGMKIYNITIDRANETVQTDIPNVTDWRSFASACLTLTAASPCQFMIRVIGNPSSDVVFQILGSANPRDSWGIEISEGNSNYFTCGNSDGDYAELVLSQSNFGVFGFEFL